MDFIRTIFFKKRGKMKHIIISDTHSPIAIDKAFNYSKEVLKTHKDVDAIVINGDLLGIFSITESSLYKEKHITPEEMMKFLQKAAPNFYSTFMETKTVTPDMVQKYVEERYMWCYDTIQRFSDLHPTIFNLGNHESEHHLLVLQELPFLTGCSRTMIDNMDKGALKEVVADFERNLYDLEKSGRFRYISDTPIIVDKTLILGIPGKSHETDGPDPESKIQEAKTEELIEIAKPMLSKVNSIIIYNHTQGAYNKQMGSFWTASKSLSKFMKELPENVLRRVFVQSHNHWSYSQFIMNQGFNILMNNAGLHDGIFNMIDFNAFTIKCFDMDPNHKRITELKTPLSNGTVKDDKELVARFYEDISFVMKRKEAPAYYDALISM